MLEPHRIEELICIVSAMDRQSIVDQCLHFPGPFPIDFTPEFLAGLSLDRLRHIFVAVCMQSEVMPPRPANHPASHAA